MPRSYLPISGRPGPFSLERQKTRKTSKFVPDFSRKLIDLGTSLIIITKLPRLILYNRFQDYGILSVRKNLIKIPLFV